MTFDRWLELTNVAWPVAVFIAGGAWRVFSRIEKRLDALEGRLGSIDRLLGFHHQVLAWHDAAIDHLEERKTG